METLGDIGEFGFIDRIRSFAGAPASEVLVGIGDDCAVLDVGGRDQLLVTTDAALEGRHFRLDWLTPFEAARRATMGAISDIAAMGGRPCACFSTLALPRDCDAKVAEELARGIARTAREFGAPLTGGDIVAGQEQILMDLVVIGWAQRPWLRSGALGGDVLAVTGPLGGPAAALDLLQEDPAFLREPGFSAILERFASPAPRTIHARALAGLDAIHGAIDISDGLVQDARHMAQASGLGLVIHAGEIPCLPQCDQVSRRLSRPATWNPATSGEEYELALAIDPVGLSEANLRLTEAALGPLIPVGAFLEGSGVVLLGDEGEELDLASGGWDHFQN